MAKEEYEQMTLTEDNTPDQIVSKDVVKSFGSNEALLLKLQQLFNQDMHQVIKWREKARKDVDFYTGYQWSDRDAQALRDQNRPVITMNRIKVLVNAVVGSEINNRREVQYFPREIGDAYASELLTGAGEWFRQESQAEDEETIAFQDTVVAGMGWVDTRLDFENDPEGRPVVQRLDPFKMVWDSSASRQNLADAQRLWYVDEKPLSIAKQMFPDAKDEDFNADWANNVIQGIKPWGDVHDQEIARRYLTEKDGSYDDDVNKLGDKLVRIIECRYLESVTVYQITDPSTYQKIDITKEQIKQLEEMYPGLELPVSEVKKKVVKRVFLGNKILAEPDEPAVPSDSFGWECITGYYDKKYNTYHGLVRDLIDVQEWTNKFFSQIMYILNSQSKGGILAERGAFEDERQAEQSLARSDSITWMNTGGANRIVPKPQPQFPQGFWTMFLESKDELTQISGLSPEFIGTREVNQPGVLEAQRRQSTLNLLATLFNSLRRYRQRQGKVILYLIQNYLSDGRLIRIVGDGKAQYVPLTRESMANIEYDIIVDDAPTSPNEKEKTFGIMQQLLPSLQPFMTPEIAIEVLRYSPLPATLVEKIASAYQEQSEQPPAPDPQIEAMQAKMQMDMQKAQADLQIKQASAQIDLQAKQEQSQMDIMKKAIELQIKQNEAYQKNQVDAAKLSNDIQKLDVQRVANQLKRESIINNSTRG